MVESNLSDSTTSAARIAANRANAQRSTGPRSEEGKARSSQNAVRHGLFTHAVGFPAAPLEEERPIFDAIVKAGRERYQPGDAEEALMVDRIAALWWELQRVHKDKQQYIRALLDKGTSPTEALLAGDAHEVKERRYERAISKLRRDLDFLQRQRLGQNCRHSRAEIEAHDRLMECLTLEQRKAAAGAGQGAAHDAGHGASHDAGHGASPEAEPVPPVPADAFPVATPRHAPRAAMLAAQAGLLRRMVAPPEPAAPPPDPPPVQPKTRGNGSAQTGGSAFGSDD